MTTSKSASSFNQKTMKKRTIIRIYPLVIMGLLLMFSSSCKKKKATDSTNECVAVGNTVVSNTNGFDRPVGIAFSPGQKVVVTEFHGMNPDGTGYAYGSPGAVKIYNSTANFYTNISDVSIPFAIINNGPEAVVFDANENLYIAETENTAGISIFQSPYAIKLKTIWGGFNNPRGIALDGSGNLYVADDGNGKIVKITNPLGVDAESDLITGLTTPKAVAISGNYIFIAEYDANRVTKYNIASPGASVETFNIDHPIDLHVSGCMLYISSHGAIYGGYGSSKVVAVKADNMNAGIQKEYTGFTGITFGIATDQAGNLFISDFSDGKIRKYLK